MKRKISRKKKINPLQMTGLIVLPLFILLGMIVGVVVLLLLPYYIECEGKIVPAEHHSIHARASGVVTSNLVYDGREVRKGDFLFALRNEHILLSLSNTELQISNLTRTLHFLTQRLALLGDEGRLNVGKARRDYERKKRLHADRLISKEEYDRTKIAWQNADIHYRLRTSELKDTIAANNSRLGELQINIQKIQEDLSNTIYLAPIDGRIIYLSHFNPLEREEGASLEIDLREGNYVVSGLLMFYIIPNLQLKAEILIPESKIYDVKIGSEVLLHLHSLPYQKFRVFRGPITDISKSSRRGKFVGLVEITNDIVTGVDFRGKKMDFDVYFLNAGLRAKVKGRPRSLFSKIFNLP